MVGSEHHDYHHYVGGQSQSNFASIFTYCDYIYGTDKPKPRVDYTLKEVCGSLPALPRISYMIDDTMNSIVTDMLQWPQRIVVPLGGILVKTRL
ncbi:calcium-dependent lipid-binding protein-like [Vicia villosa]|uniref:calcium-dependent lipid-binding protein-like n=1 Tax=Vicia villosa TaxID=3911 RepID=UPI00273C7E95|nr:calcium-dependent lipid-binding protein-like [Vicia villosa]